MAWPVRDASSAIKEGARGLGVELSGEQAQALGDFVQLIGTWNRRFSLVGTRDESALINRHILDSLAPVRVLESAANLVDLGTGAGLPGIPIAVARPDLSVTLVDSRRVRTNFLREVVRRLALANVGVVETRIEQLTNDSARTEPFDATVARAWAGLPMFLDASARLLRPGGIAVSMKGPTVRAELAALGDRESRFTPAQELDYRLPEARARRTLLVFSRR